MARDTFLLQFQRDYPEYPPQVRLLDPPCHSVASAEVCNLYFYYQISVQSFSYQVECNAFRAMTGAFHLSARDAPANAPVVDKASASKVFECGQS